MEGPFASCDLSRTVGWFTTAFPLLFSALDFENIRESLLIVKEHLRAVPSQGLRFLSSPTRAFATILFNYLGQLETSFSESFFFQEASEGVGQLSSSQNAPFSDISVDAVVERGALAFAVSMVASKYRKETAGQLCNLLSRNLRRVVTHCISQSVVSYSPSDFPLAKVTQATLEVAMDGIRSTCGSSVELEDVFPVNPLQAGILYHSLLNTGTKDPYFNQIVWQIDTALSPQHLASALENLFREEPVLRSAFITENVEEPLQYVLKPQYATFSIRICSLESNPLDSVLSEDRSLGLSLHKAPICRATLLSGPTSIKFVILTTHHSLIDGWSVPLLQSRLEKLCTDFNRTGKWNQTVSPQVGSYAAWLNKQSRASQLEYWQSRLSGAEPLHVSAFFPPPPRPLSVLPSLPPPPAVKKT
eukprot:TRINITY_DN671_c0_g2_i1.p1 TRINITY_DN671_c0_g2~~TRINITY_DN671_c0_g2_i1.p1  ORF type:complete len:471 (+),score=68.27 TRINITY_DN671_c0_g2_i1:163-1413(+)